MSGYVNFKPPVYRVLSRSIDSTEMSFTAMDGMITALTQQFYKGCPYISIVCTRYLRNSIIVPVRQLQGFAAPIGRLVFFQCPVGNPMTYVVRSGNQTTPGSRAQRTGIRLSKHHPLFGQTLHIRSLINTVIIGFFGPEWQGGILPSHIIYHEKNNIRTLIRTFRCLLSRQRTHRSGKCSQCQRI